jgi:hypothetical protein
VHGQVEAFVSFLTPVVLTMRNVETNATHEVLVKPRSMYAVMGEARALWSREISSKPVHTIGTQRIVRYFVVVSLLSACSSEPS